MDEKLDLDLAKHLADMSPMGIVVTDSNDKISWVNRSMCEFVAVPAEALVGHDYSELTTRYLDGFAEHSDLWKVSNIVSRQNRWLISLDCPPSNALPGNAKYFADVTELMKLKSEVRNLKDQLENNSSADTLTGLLNKKALFQALEPQVSRSRRYGNPLSVIIMEIEGFKTTDAKVSPVTDQALTAVSFYLRDQMRWVDLVGRTQDNEFTLILPETTENDAVKLANKIQARIQSLSLPESPDVTISVNAKFGICSWEKGDDTNMLLRKCKTNMSEVIPAEEGVVS